jgi:hypothetical protein
LARNNRDVFCDATGEQEQHDAQRLQISHMRLSHILRKGTAAAVGPEGTNGELPLAADAKHTTPTRRAPVNVRSGALETQ